MQLHGPKRVYNLTALECWFNKLTSSWERFFPEPCVEMGRRFYREGLIREIELSEKDAIIHSKIDGKECYAVIDWSNGRPSTRASIRKGNMGQALAIAGLYEIEEMVVDEISPLPADAEEQPAGEARLEERLTEVKKQEASGRQLHLCFDIGSEGLLFDAWWVNGDAAARAPALGQGCNGNLLASERESLIRLASLTRKGHFQFSQKTQRYVLPDASRVSVFLKQDVQGWEKFFTVELSPSVRKLTQGVREVVVEARAKSRAGGGDLNLEWIFRAGEKLLSAAEAEAVLQQPGGAILLPEIGLVELSRDRSQAVCDWRQKGAGAQEQTIPKYLLVSLFQESRIQIEADPELEAWRKRLLAAPKPLRNLPSFLRNYQRQGVQWMSHLCDLDCHGLLADEMGLGKTVQVIALMASRPTAEKRHLVVAPASVIPVWQKEFARFCPEMPIHVLKNGCNFVTHDAPGVWLASYTQLRRHSDLLPKTTFGYAVLDEAQLIKNPEAKVTRACFGIGARHRLILTGTPLENRQLDLWSLFGFLMPNLLGSRSAFESAGTENPEEFLSRLRAQVAPFVLRRTKRKVAAELPKKIEMTLSAPLTVRQRDEYARICREGLDRLGDSLSETMRDRSFGLFSLLTRLRQVCCDPGLLPWSNDPWEESGKINALLEQLSAIVEGGHKVVIFSQFVALLNRVGQALDVTYPDLKRYALTGSTIDREKPVEEFQNHDGSAVMLVSLRAGGTGITLHAADYVFLLDPWWNPAVEAQAIDRVHRIGQTNTVFVYRMVTSGTIEERIQDLKEKKRELFESVIGGIGVMGDLRQTFASLRHLIELGEDDKG